MPGIYYHPSLATPRPHTTLSVAALARPRTLLSLRYVYARRRGARLAYKSSKSLCGRCTAGLTNVDYGRSTNGSQSTANFPDLEKFMFTTPALRQIRREEVLDLAYLDRVVHYWDDIAVPTLLCLKDNQRLIR